MLAITAGIVGEAVFEFVGLAIMPALLGMAMKPALLVAELFKSLTSLDLSMFWAWSTHLLAGIVIFPMGYVLFRRVVIIQSWLLAGMIWGVLFWLLAQTILAPLAGRPFMLGFVPYTWAALAVHLIYAATVAFVLHLLSQRSMQLALKR